MSEALDEPMTQSDLLIVISELDLSQIDRDLSQFVVSQARGICAPGSSIRAINPTWVKSSTSISITGFTGLWVMSWLSDSKPFPESHCAQWGLSKEFIDLYLIKIIKRIPCRTEVQRYANARAIL
jgi:hypothetical protein